MDKFIISTNIKISQSMSQYYFKTKNGYTVVKYIAYIVVRNKRGMDC